MFDNSLRSLEAWMQGGGDLRVILFCCLLPVVTIWLVLVHELGHATVALLTTRGPVSLCVGNSHPLWHGRIGRLDVELNGNVWSGGAVSGHVQQHEWSRPVARLWLALGGALANVILAVLLVPAAAATGGFLRAVLGVTAVLSLLTAAWSLMPRSRGKRTGDWLIALDAWRALRGRDDFDRLWSRHEVVVSGTEGAALRTRERAADLLAGVKHLLALDGQPSENPALLSAWLAAFHGWSWRHVEPALSERDLAVEQAIGQTPAIGPDERVSLVSAACQLAGNGAEPAEVSRPGKAEPRRLARERALASVAEDPKIRELDERSVALSFRFGLALHDLERSAGLV